jgi:hypothetical protein
MPIIILTLVLIWLLLKKKKKPVLLVNSEEPISFEETTEPLESELEVLELVEDNLDKDVIPVGVINFTEFELYHYKVYEEHNGNANDNKQYYETYYFKTGNLLKRKFDAEDWYNRRRIAISNKQLYFQGNQTSKVKFGVKLYFIDCINNETPYLLKDEFGIDNRDNRMFEGLILKKAGYDKSSPISNLIPRNSADSINTFLKG